MNLLITGAAGFIGSHLVEALSKLGYKIKAVDCFLDDSYDENLKKANWKKLSILENIDLFQLDLRNEIPKNLLEDVNIIVNLAAMPGLMKSWSDFKIYSSCNIEAVENLIRVAKENDVKHFIQISTSSVYGLKATGVEESNLEPISPYGVTKLAAEELIKTYNRTYNLDFTILRYFSVYGPRQRPDMAYHKIISSIINDREVEIFGDGSQTRTNTFISDCLDATISAIKILPKNEVINISGTSYNTLMQAVSIMENILNKKAKLIFKQQRPGDQQETKGNISKARLLLNYEPKVELKDGLKKQIQWHLSQQSIS